MRNELSELKMNGALEVLDDYLKLKLDNLNFGQGLLRAEIAAKKNRLGLAKIAKAKFPYVKEWPEIRDDYNSNIQFDKIKKFSNGDFVQNKKNICLIGTPGLGKTHSIISIGRDLCRKSQDVLFFTASDLVEKLEEAKDKKKLVHFMDKLKKTKLLIIDELGFVPFTENGSRLLFDVFTSRYNVGSIAITTNLSFEKWTQVFGAIELTAALIDRFTHNCEIFVFEGESVRFIEAKELKKKQTAYLKKKKDDGST
jgi:DNA replication protein DnaC